MCRCAQVFAAARGVNAPSPRTRQSGVTPPPHLITRACSRSRGLREPHRVSFVWATYIKLILQQPSRCRKIDLFICVAPALPSRPKAPGAPCGRSPRLLGSARKPGASQDARAGRHAGDSHSGGGGRYLSRIYLQSHFNFFWIPECVKAILAQGISSLSQRN